ncbi:MAG: hypothetical protein JNK14_09555 [Chitinophagaceae bacterium]|nr:hypothetical protein [Chitinophagaceae bacterium]
MSDPLSSKQFELTGQLYMNLKRSETAYKEYLGNGKTFRYARILRVYNEKIRQLVMEKGYLLPHHLQQDGLDLVSHYDVWMQKWDELKEQINPSPDDEFVFPNSVTFPKEAARHLEQEYERIKQVMVHAE